MLNSPTDNLIVLKDVPGFWRRPSFVKIDNSLSMLTFEIYYSILFGQDVPQIVQPYITRGTIATSETKVAYFVGLLIINKPYATFAYPPTGTNQVDPIALMVSGIKLVHYIEKAEFDQEFDYYKPSVPATLVAHLQALGGRW